MASSTGSLGFNPNRRHRATNLPGSINALVVRPRVPGQRRAQAPKSVSVIIPRRTSPTMTSQTQPSSIAPSSVASPPVPNTTAPPPTPRAEEEVHWAYATVGPNGLRATSDTDTLVCVKNSRVMLLYPMISDSDTGIVSMKAKTVDATTGQLKCAWVDVYDPNTDTRFVTHFSMVP